MSGKRKSASANRTKNNLRPSSSGRSAQFLCSTGTNVHNLNGDKTGGVPSFSLSNLSSMDANIDTCFQLVFKKMTKKDCTTKVKALQEFSELVRNSEVSTIVDALHIWCKLYCSLITESDHRIRESTHAAHYEIIVKVQRGIVPFLKQIFPLWFLSQFDTYAPVGSMACKSLQAAFSEEKMVKAVVFCQDSFLTHIYECLTTTSVDNKLEKLPDENANYERQIVTCLDGYTYYISNISHEKLNEMNELNAKIMDNKNFWKLSNHSNNIIRLKWFKLVSTVVQKAVFLLKDKRTHVIKLMITCLNDQDPIVLPVVYEFLLLTMTYIENWSDEIKVEQKLLPKLWQIIKNGANGNATVIYPNLLPLVAKLPKTVITESFYTTLLQNIFSGLNVKSVLNSKSESSVIINVYLECIQYILHTHQTDVNFCTLLVENHLITMIDWIFSLPELNETMYFNNVVSFMQMCNKQANCEPANNYHFCNQAFWCKLREDLLGKCNAMTETYDLHGIVCSLRKMTAMFTCFTNNNAKMKCTVRFACTNEDTVQRSNSKNENSTLFIHNINEIAYEIAVCVMKLVDTKRHTQLLFSLHQLLRITDCKALWHLISSRLLTTSDIFQLYENWFTNWCQCEMLQSQILIDIILLWYKYLPGNEKNYFLSSFKEIAGEDCFLWLLKRSISQSLTFRRESNIKEWLTGEQIGSFVVKCVEDLLNQEITTEKKELLYEFLTSNNDLALHISNETIRNIIKIICRALLISSDASSTIATCISLAFRVADVVYSETYANIFSADLFLSLFALLCSSKQTTIDLSDEVWCQLEQCCQRTMTNISMSTTNRSLSSLLTNMGILCEKELLTSSYDVDGVKRLESTLTNTLRCINSSKYGCFSKISWPLFECRYIATFRKPFRITCGNMQVLCGALCCPNRIPSTKHFTLTDLNILQYITWQYLKCKLFVEYVNTVDFQSDEWNESDVASEFGMLLYDTSLIESITSRYKCFDYSEVIRWYTVEMISHLKRCTNVMHSNVLKTFLCDRINSGDSTWISALVLYIQFQDVECSRGFNANCTECLSLLISSEHRSNVILQLSLKIESNWKINDLPTNLLDCDDLFNIVLVRCLQLKDADTKKHLQKIFQNRARKLLTVNVSDLLNNSANNWTLYQELVEVVRLWSTLIKEDLIHLDSNYWDFGEIALLSLIQYVSSMQNQSALQTLHIQCLLHALCNLYLAIVKCVEYLKCTKPDSNIISEWRDLFEQNVSINMLKIWLEITEVYSALQRTSLSNVYLLQSFNEITKYINCDGIFTSNSILPKWPSIVTHCSSLVIHPMFTVQVMGYNMLLILVPKLVNFDQSSYKESSVINLSDLKINVLLATLKYAEDIVNRALFEFIIGENSCQVEPSTDSFTYIFGYLLVWDVLLTFFEHCGKDLRRQYGQWMSQQNIVDTLLENIFRLMPEDVLHCNEDDNGWYSVFSEDVCLNFDDCLPSSIIQHLAVRLYTKILLRNVTSVRRWWLNIEQKPSQIVEKVTATYLADFIFKQHSSEVVSYKNELKNMSCKTYLSARQVIAIYTVEDNKMEVCIRLPPAYPLHGPEVMPGDQSSCSTSKQWLIQLRKCLLHRDGHVWDGLLLWKHTLDNKFESIEECYICFTVLHQSTQQLPKLSCQTCKKKFHSACLYKWFSTSNKNSCPVCRNLF